MTAWMATALVVVGCGSSTAWYESEPTPPLAVVAHDHEVSGPRVLARGWVWCPVPLISPACVPTNFPGREGETARASVSHLALADR